MMKKMLKQSVGQHRRIWPPIIQTIIKPERPRHLWRRRYRDDAWFIQSDNDGKLHLLASSGHFIDMPYDNVIEFRNAVTGPGYLMLNSQIFIEGVNIMSVPLARRFTAGLYARRVPSRRRVSAVR